jgi:hypothetical protein
MVLANIGDVVEDDQVILVELGYRGLKRKFATRHLQSLYQIGSAHEQHAPAIFDERQPDGGRQVTFAAAGRNSVTMPGVQLSRYGSTIEGECQQQAEIRLKPAV